MIIGQCDLLPGGLDCKHQFTKNKCPGVAGHKCCGRTNLPGADNLTAKALLDDAIKSATEKGLNKTPPIYNDGTCHLSDTSAIAKSPEPSMRGAAPQRSSLRTRN